MTQVQIRDTCLRCDGTGVVTPLAWRTWDMRRDAHIATLTHLRRWGAEWWADLDAWERANPVPATPERIGCRDCGGGGYLTRWVDLRELADLMASAARDGVTP